VIPPFVLQRIGVNGIKPEDVNGWFTVPLESYEAIACAPNKVFMCPCFWPFAVCCLPCIGMAYLSAKQTIPTMAWVTTKKSIVAFVEKKGACSKCFSAGQDNAETQFKVVQSIKANNSDTGFCICLTCCTYPALDIVLSTMHSTGGKHPRMVNDILRIPCQDPNSSAAFLRGMVDHRENMLAGLEGHEKTVITRPEGTLHA